MTKECKALLRTMYIVILEIRAIGWEGIENKSLTESQILFMTECANVIHNVPNSLIYFDEGKIDFLLNSFSRFTVEGKKYDWVIKAYESSLEMYEAEESSSK